MAFAMSSGYRSSECHTLKGWFLIALVVSSHFHTHAALPLPWSGSGNRNSFASSPFRQPSAAVVALSAISVAWGDPARRLAEVELVEGWKFPDGTTIRLDNNGRMENSAFGSGHHGGSSIETVILAGYRYQGVTIFSPGGQFSTHLEPTIKAAKASTTRDGALTREACALTTHAAPMGMDQSGKAGLVVQTDKVSPLAGPTKLEDKIGEVLKCTRYNPYIQFMHGGSYKLCYTADGTFEGSEYRNAVFNPVITVIGVSSSCESHGCLSSERWDCYFGYRGEAQGECRFDFRKAGGRVGWGINYVGLSRLSWTSAWRDDETLLGALQASFPEKCSDTAGDSGAMAPEIAKFDSESMPAEKSIKVDHNAVGVFPSVGKDEKATKAFTVTPCYCPNFDSYDTDMAACSDPSEFIQSIGRLYFWTVRICDYVNYATCGEANPAYMRFVPQESFVLRIQCPPGGACAATQANRVKIIRAVPGRTAVDEKDSYDLMQRCKTVVADSEVVLWPEIGDSLSLSGGDQVDYKIWREKQVRLTVSMDEMMDVCYCDTSCGDATQFFKVGQVRSVASIGLAYKNKVGTVDDDGEPLTIVKTFDVMGKPGTITLGAGTTTPLKESMRPYDSVPFSGRALVKMMSFDREPLYGPKCLTEKSCLTLQKLHELHRKENPSAQKELDKACSEEPFRADYATGPSSAAQAKKFIAEIPDNEVSQYLTFSGSSQDGEFAMKMSGVFAICYCAVLSEQSNCQNDKYWLMARQITIRGPDGRANLLYPTDMVVRVQLLGWGFGMNDTMRFVATTQTCTENAFNPLGNTEVRMNCPSIDGSGCTLMGVKENLYTEIETSNSTEIYIEKVAVDNDFSTLTFTKDLGRVLREGDHITIEEGSVLLSSNSSTQWSEAERYTVSKLTGMYTYTDDPTRRHMLAQYISEEGVPESLKKTDRRIPVGWTFEQRPRFSFTGEGGRWLRRNRLRTRQELKANEQMGSLKMCWGVFDEDGGRRYFADAGTITFQHPPRMQDAGIHLTTREDGSKAPIVLSFIPKLGNRVYQQYGVQTLLRIVFRDVGRELEPLFSGDVGSSLDEELIIPSLDEKLPVEASQITCGKLFLELYANDEGGFPMPRGCYYTKRLQDDVNSGGGTQPFTREYFIAFEPHYGLKSRCYDPRLKKTGPCLYQLVLNAHLKGVKKTSTELVSLYTMCAEPEDPNAATPCDRPYNVWEVGRARPSLQALKRNAASPTLGRVDIADRQFNWFSTTSLNIPSLMDFKADTIDADTGLELKGFSLRATPKDRLKPITSGAILRIFFTPFTMWDLGESPCKTECIENPGVSVTGAKLFCDDTKGGKVGSCRGEKLVKSTDPILVSSPFVKITYPISITPISNNETAHALDISRIRLPPSGFFATNTLVQLSDAGDGDPSTVFIGQKIFRFPPKGATQGMLLIEGQAGAPKPFMSEKDNALIARIMLGATLRGGPLITTTTTTTTGSDFNADNATCDNSTCDVDNVTMPAGRRLQETEEDTGVRLEISLPKGYLCTVEDDALFTTTHPLFLRDDNLDGYRDYYHGKISGGTWKFKENKCIYQVAPNQGIFVGQIFFVRLSVQNPRFPLGKDDPTNVWKLTIFGGNGQSLGDSAPFLSLDKEAEYPGWAGNLAVIGKVSVESLQPTVFGAGETHDLEVFFRANRDTSDMGYVIVDAPDGFDFGNPCTAGDLQDEYYADWHATPWGEAGAYPRTRRFGGFHSCVGVRWDTLPSDYRDPPTANFTRARIRLHKRLQHGTHYAFKIRIKNAPTYRNDFHNTWRIWTQDTNGYFVEGAYRTLLMNPARMGTIPPSLFDRSWGTTLRRPGLPVKLNFGGPSVIPTSMTEMPTVVTIYPLKIWARTQEGPEVDAGGWSQTRKETSGTITLRVIAPFGYQWMPQERNGFFGFIPNVTCAACLIYDPPKQPQKNEIIFEDMTVMSSLTYGFQIKIRVPNNPPLRSSNRFFLEFGYDTKDNRLQGEAVQAPPLRAVYNVKVRSLCNALAFMDNIMDFHVDTVTPLGPNEGFVFWGDKNTALTELYCFPGPLPGSMELPKDSQCSFFKDRETGLPVMILSVTKDPFPAGRYAFSFKGVGNTQKMPSGPAGWTVGTYRNVHEYPNIREIDKSAKAFAPQILTMMPEADIVRPTEQVRLACGRDDRPSVRNYLVFFFRLSKAPLVPPSQKSLVLALRGPPGFFFDEECTSHLSVGNSTWGSMNETNPCSPGTAEKWCPAKPAVWPDRLKPTNCQGFDNTAKISVPNTNGWEADKAYMFRIGLTNPTDDSPGKWSLDFATEASLPFEGFSLSTFKIEPADGAVDRVKATGPTTADGYKTLGLYAASTAESGGEFSPDGFKPVSVLFRPSIKVPAPYNTKRKLKERELQVSALPPEEGAEEGFLELQAPKGFIFPLRKGACDGMILERAERTYEDEDVQLHPNVDQVCTVYGKNKLVIRLVGNQPLQKSVIYRLLVTVVNPMVARPPEPWYLSSFKREYNKHDEYIPLDRTMIPGYAVTPKLKKWYVNNLSKEYNGLFKVRLVRLTIQFPDPVKDGDFVTISPPLGFTLGPPEAPEGYSGACLGFRWPSALIPLPNSPPPVCTCSGREQPRCSLTFTVSEGGKGSDGGPATVLVPGQELDFEISTFNPRSAPDPFQNYWRAEHTRKTTMLASGSIDGWPIRAQLTQVMVNIVGGETRANSISDLLVEFIPVSWARSLELVIHEPKGFNFYDCKLPSPLEKDRRTKGGRLVAVGGRFLGGNPVAIFVSKVIMGDVGGDTIIDLRTFRDDALAIEVDQKLSFLRGFRLPGEIDVISQRVEGLHEVRYYNSIGNSGMLRRNYTIQDQPSDLTGGSCESLDKMQITTSEECVEAANELGLKAGTMFGFPRTNVPGGCIFEVDNEDVDFNSNIDERTTNSDRRLICKEPPAGTRDDAPLVLFPARVGELARLELYFTITKPPLPGQKLVLRTFSKAEEDTEGARRLQYEKTMEGKTWPKQETQKAKTQRTDDGALAVLSAAEPWQPRLSRCVPELILQDEKQKPRPPPRWHLWEGFPAELVCNEEHVNVTNIESWYTGEENPDDRTIYALSMTLNASDPFDLPLVYDPTGKRSEWKPTGAQALWVDEKVMVRRQPVWFETKKIIYRLRAWFIPASRPTFWRLETQDGGALPTNTNDGLDRCLTAVHNMDFQVVAKRTPPQAVIRTNLKLKWGPEQELTRLEVILPPNFTYFRVQKVPFEGTDRLYAPLTQKAEWWQDFIANDRDLELRINSPIKTPTDKRWFLRALTPSPEVNFTSSMLVTGWGIAEGFSIHQMKVSIRYAPVERFTGWVLIEFRVLQETIDDGTYVIIRAPEEFRFACSPWLDEVQCAVSDYGKLGRDRIANLTLAGSHVDGANMVCSFLMGLRTPEVPPDDEEIGTLRYWDVQIFDAEHECVDAAFQIPSPKFVFGVYIEAPTIAWTNNARPGERSIVTVELVLTRRVRKVKSVLISMPVRFRHDILRYKEFRNLNRNFPVALDRDWRVFENRRWVKILIDDMNSTKTLQFLPADTYRWQFPIMVPTTFPASKTWFLSLCLDYFCEAPNDAHVLASFPIPGIGITDAGAQAGTTGQSGATRLCDISSFGALLSFLTALRGLSVR